MRQDGCGTGTSRGGLGFLRRDEILADDVRLSLYSDRFRRSPDGLFGGGSGTTGFCEVLRDGRIISLKSKDAFDLQKGDVVTLAVDGFGGYGDPAGRPAERIRRDMQDGIISPGTAPSRSPERQAAE